jgi:uncharacterized protein (TIGR02246 family)
MRQWIVAAFLLATGTFCVVVASDQLKSSDDQSDGRGHSRTGVPRQKAENVTDSARQGSSTKLSPQATAIKTLSDQLVAAYKRGNAKAFAALFTVDGEYIDASEVVFHGRKAITDEFTIFFRETTGSSMKIDVKSIRSIGRNLIAAECVTQFREAEAATPSPGKCRMVCVREGEGWQIASLQEFDDDDVPATSHHEHVRQLEWMIGEWIGEGGNSHVHFSCRWDENGQYLLRDFSIESANSKPLKGTQRIGFDPLTQRLRMWVFDSAGGFSEGSFFRDGDAWILKTSGVTAEGQSATATDKFTRVDEHRMSSETTDHFISGQRVKESESLTIVRKPPHTLDVSEQIQLPKN